MQIHYPEAVEIRRPRTLWKDTLVGVAAGVVGTWVMEQFWKGLSAAQEAAENRGDGEARASGTRTDGSAGEQEGGGGPAAETAETAADAEGREENPLDEIALVGPYHREEESAPQTAARVLYRKARGREPDEETRMELATRLHWAQGMAMGGLYGLFRGDRREGLDLTGGLVFGAAVWLAADELAVPLLGLSRGPTAHERAEHLQGLGAHLVYGAATSIAAQALSRMT